jgi:hypothetical protein
METKKHTKNQWNSWFFEKTNKMDKLLAKLTKKKEKKKVWVVCNPGIQRVQQ